MRFSALWDLYKKLAEVPDYYFWRLRGSPMRGVPHLVKQRILQEHARSYGLRTMVETGTNLGQMINAMLQLMDNIYSIEMDDWSYERAVRRFAGQCKVHMIRGSSAQELPRLLPTITQPTLFWLDAHNFDLETPVREELQAISAHMRPGHVILIDDSSWFDGRNQYPTMEWVQRFVNNNLPGYTLKEEMHMIQIIPKWGGLQSPDISI